MLRRDRVPAKLQTEINVVLIQSHNIHPAELNHQWSQIV